MNFDVLTALTVRAINGLLESSVNWNVRTEWCDENVIGVGSSRCGTVQRKPNLPSRKCLSDA
jgi:hypothetical protein